MKLLTVKEKPTRLYGAISDLFCCTQLFKNRTKRKNNKAMLLVSR